MLTALTVKFMEKEKGIKGLLSRLRRDTATVDVDRARGVYFKHITYTSYGGKLHLERLEKNIGDSRFSIICDEKIELPEKSNMKRFHNTDFSARLCTNFVLNLLKECEFSEKIKIGIYDTDGKNSDFLAHIMKYTSDVTVVTNSADCYHEAIENIMEEMGACAVVTQSTDELASCDIIIAPQNITESFPVRDDALVFTIGRPKAEVGGELYYKYCFKMPNGFDRIKPEELDAEYFCSALYTLGRQYQLGSLVPTLCVNYSTSQTAKSLGAYIERFA